MRTRPLWLGLLGLCPLWGCLWISAEDHSVRTDVDGDGVPAALDCDDQSAEVYPGAVERPCDELNNDCQPETADGPVWLGRRPGAEGGSVVGTFETLEEAMQLAEPGAIIGLCMGVFQDRLRIDKDGIVLAGSGLAEQTVLDGQGEEGPVLEIVARDVVIRQLTVQGGRGSSRDGLTYGGGIQAIDAGGPVSLFAVNIVDNEADRGGGVAGPAGSLLTVGEGSVIEGNAAQEGGGLYLSGDAVLQGSQVRSNTAGQGGGIALLRGALSLPDSEISLNQATVGGGIWAGPQDIGLPGSVEAGLVRANAAAEAGGGIWLEGGSVTGTRLEDNEAGGRGGGIFGGGTLVSAVLLRNEAPSGGGVAAVGALALRGTRIEANSASQDGGGLLVTSGTEVQLDEEQDVPSSIVANAAGQRGGNVAVLGGSLTGRRTEISQGQAPQGGGIAAMRGDCQGCELTLADSGVSQNLAEQGGGIWTELPLSLTDSALEGNLAQVAGGALYTSVRVVGERVQGRQNGAGEGGFAYLEPGSEIDLTHTQLEGNSCTAQGAALRVLGSARLFESQVAESSCPEGGALALGGSGALDLDGVQFSDNVLHDLTWGGPPCGFDSSDQITGLCSALSCPVCD